jgi:hypothetical protein
MNATAEALVNDITPQRLGSIVKSSGVRKSRDKKGNFYNYHTEGYRLNSHWKGRYTIEYVKELRLSIMTDSERDNFEQRKNEALSVIAKSLTDKGVKFGQEGDEITIYLAQRA